MTESEELSRLREFLKVYRAAYMDTQTNPTPRQESEVMTAAILADRNDPRLKD